MIVRDFLQKGYKITRLLKGVGLSPSQYYEREKHLGKRGRKVSLKSQTKTEGSMSNEQVVDAIRLLLENPFVDYGYEKVTYWLREEKNLIINFKKVYRLMKENQLLQPKKSREKQARIWVKDLVPKPKQAFENIEMDIKYVYLQGPGRNAMTVTVIDVFSRLNMVQHMAYSITKAEISALMKFIKDNYSLPEKVMLRTDNGSQFTARMVKEELELLQIGHEYTLPATPEQNAHIEAYHSIVERTICKRFEFDSLAAAQEIFHHFRQFYNFERIHSGIGYKSPVKFLKENGLKMSEKEFYPSGWRMETSANDGCFEARCGWERKFPGPANPFLQTQKTTLR